MRKLFAVLLFVLVGLVLPTLAQGQDLSNPKWALGLVAPQFAVGGGWTTQVILKNTSPVVTQGVMGFGNQQGFYAAVEVTDLTGGYDHQLSLSYNPGTLQPGEVRTVTLTLASTTTLVGDISLESLATVSGGNSVQFSVVYSLGNESATVVPVFPSSKFGFVDNAQAVRTGVAISSLNARAVVVSCVAQDLQGNQVTTATISIVAGGQVAKYVDEFFTTLPSTWAGGEIICTSPSGPVAAMTIQETPNTISGGPVFPLPMN